MTNDGGASWAWTDVTSNSDVDNLRPVVPIWDEHHTALLWLRGTYTSYHDYDLDVVGIITDRSPTTPDHRRRGIKAHPVVGAATCQPQPADPPSSAPHRHMGSRHDGGGGTRQSSSVGDCDAAGPWHRNHPDGVGSS